MLRWNGVYSFCGRAEGYSWIVLFEKDDKQYACAIGEVCTYFAICDIAVWENLEEEEREKVLWESTR